MPTLVISLDFELHWGRFDKYDIASCQDYYKKTLDFAPRILELFDSYGIHATWATVGMLMAADWEEWESYKPKQLPEFSESKYSAYYWAHKHRNEDLKALFAPEMVKEILSTPGQELASHTFSHYYTGLKGSGIEAFRADLKAAKKIAQEKFDINLKSLVFPRNQYNDAYLNASFEEGFDFVRTNPQDWFWHNTADESLIRKIFRTGDTLVSLGHRTSYPQVEILETTQLAIPASRLLRPYSSNSVFNKLRIDRILYEMEYAAKNGQIYHLWWHPHNFVYMPKENMMALEEILDFAVKLRDEYGFESLTMEELGVRSLEKSASNSAKIGFLK